LAAKPGSYPLQLATDFQLRAHSPFDDARDALNTIVTSFVESGNARRLVIVGHPLDEGLINWRRLIRGFDRGVFLEGGIPDALLAGAAGVLTVNSTVGLTALRYGIPVKTLGTAIYDIPGLTHPGDLADFWHTPLPPDRALTGDFLRALIGATQIKGGYHTRAAQAHALPAFVERLENGPFLRAQGSLLSRASQSSDG
jgi:capsular polysaccharide export protein